MLFGVDISHIQQPAGFDPKSHRPFESIIIKKGIRPISYKFIPKRHSTLLVQIDSDDVKILGHSTRFVF